MSLLAIYFDLYSVLYFFLSVKKPYSPYKQNVFTFSGHVFVNVFWPFLNLSTSRNNNLPEFACQIFIWVSRLDLGTLIHKWMSVMFMPLTNKFSQCWFRPSPPGKYLCIEQYSRVVKFGVSGNFPLWCISIEEFYIIQQWLFCQGWSGAQP